MKRIFYLLPLCLLLAGCVGAQGVIPGKCHVAVALLTPDGPDSTNYVPVNGAFEIRITDGAYQDKRVAFTKPGVHQVFFENLEPGRTYNIWVIPPQGFNPHQFPSRITQPKPDYLTEVKIIVPYEWTHLYE